MVMFTIDGVNYGCKCAITRTAEIRASDISGMLLDKTYFNDVLGTYLQYSISIEVPLYDQDRYSSLYESLTDPVDAHIVVVPYNSGRLTITGRIETVSDEYVRMPGGRNFWRKTTFVITANHPSKYYTLAGVLARGRTPLPDTAEVEIGTTYIYTSSGWTLVEYGDADNTYY